MEMNLEPSLKGENIEIQDQEVGGISKNNRRLKGLQEKMKDQLSQEY